MKTISVGDLRQNPTSALDDVEHGETYSVTRHRREIARLVPPPRRRPTRADDLRRAISRTPVDASWAQEVAVERSDFDDDRDAWDR
ncbi:type II toxin-antitoxin system Phd/YefM family antitoxin [Microbacterium sp. SA39]|uniref:type II toxin-antitoxin system Phd/YefM family antitoxin n=1 Tax=Microbacterium sp. SA39 TaxID=1263625 RepID=UPI0005FA0D7F|nr:type II toxin-antitoxin system Phd/YefM family antitoxin [Microbacterium sp. SA39]